MNLTLIILLLLILGYAGFLFFDGFIQERYAGRTLVAVRLRRRLADSFFLLFILLAGIYYEVSHQTNPVELIALCILSFLVIWQGLRYPKWRLKKEGFTFGGRYWLYEAITAMRLSEDGVLVLALHEQSLILPVAKIEDLEKAAAFFTGEEALKHLLEQSKGENVQN